MNANIHVVPRGAEWAVKREGVEEPLSVHLTQEEAETAGRAQARTDKVELELHGTDGRIREKGSYGNDPRDVPG
jgi:hypothetical protein